MPKRSYKHYEPEMIFKEKKESNIVLQTIQKELSPILGHYINCLDFNTYAITYDFLKQFAIELTNWACDNDNALVISSFYLKKGILPETYKEWIATYPILGMAHSFATAAIAGRREHGAITRKYDSKFTMFSMAMYDEEWKKLEEWKAKLKRETFEKKETHIMVIENFK